jgi:hypothetical protein
VAVVEQEPPEAWATIQRVATAVQVQHLRFQVFPLTMVVAAVAAHLEPTQDLVQEAMAAVVEEETLLRQAWRELQTKAVVAARADGVLSMMKLIDLV